MILANYFQGIGDVRRSALLSLARTYAFAIPLTFALPILVGEQGVWLAQPFADALLVVATATEVFRRSAGMASEGTSAEKALSRPTA